ncbi:hypothetical protein WJ58_15065 [Burkholderia ubonensis]|nr:hypothetical protein WJ58_15065 [Burkholderia ubonensis]
MLRDGRSYCRLHVVRQRIPLHTLSTKYPLHDSGPFCAFASLATTSSLCVAKFVRCDLKGYALRNCVEIYLRCEQVFKFRVGTIGACSDLENIFTKHMPGVTDTPRSCPPLIIPVNEY